MVAGKTVGGVTESAVRKCDCTRLALVVRRVEEVPVDATGADCRRSTFLTELGALGADVRSDCCIEVKTDSARKAGSLVASEAVGERTQFALVVSVEVSFGHASDTSGRVSAG